MTVRRRLESSSTVEAHMTRSAESVSLAPWPTISTRLSGRRMLGKMGSRRSRPAFGDRTFGMSVLLRRCYGRNYRLFTKSTASRIGGTR